MSASRQPASAGRALVSERLAAVGSIPEAPTRPPQPPDHFFRFDRDTFAYANELVWQYRFDPVTGAVTVASNDPPPTYTHRCFVLARAARQFYYHARFDPALPRLEPEPYRQLIRQVIARSPRRQARDSERIWIPGYAGLREFSAGQEALLKAECGGAWQSYFVRSHWRMVFLFPRRQQEQTARRLIEGVRRGRAPIVHIFRFPRVTINHAATLFGVTESAREIQFEAYDPNLSGQPVRLTFDREQRAFVFPRTIYFAGGKVKVTESFCGWFF